MPSNTTRKHNKRTYRSGLEDQVAAFLSDKQKEVRYETLKIEWADFRYRTYTPDFVLDNGIIVETKGKFDVDDRHKHLEIKKQHPELDIRFVFSNSNAKLYKGSKTTYAEWCDKNGFLWAHRVVPLTWLKERGKPITATRINVKEKQ